MACKVHKIRFYNPKPRAVNSLAFNRIEQWLAISRDDASIEVWDLNHAPFLLKVIPGIENGSVEALGWIHRRLISTGLGGAIVEWDLDKLVAKSSTLLTGYAAWCLDVNAANTKVAVGTEQGYVNLFSVETEEFVYEKLFDKQEGRIICCKFDKTGNVLVTGSISTIRIWNVSTGQAMHRMVTNRRGKETIVWSLAVLSDLTIVSGDSEGRLTFWDGNIAEQIESFVTHKADILTLAVSEDEQNIYCSGVDPTIVNFVKVAVNNKQHHSSKHEWVKNVQRHVHVHDVRVLAVQGKKVMSMGADGYIALSSYPPKWLKRVPPMLPWPRMSASSRRKLVLVRYSSHLEVWKLGKYSTNKHGHPQFASNKKDLNHDNSKQNKSTDNLEQDSTHHGLTLQIINNRSSNKKMLQLEEQPLKLVAIRSKGSRQLKCCAMSPDGQYIVYSTDEVIRLFKLELDEEDDKKVSLLKVFVCLSSSTCSQAVFTQDSTSLVLQWPGRIAIVHVDDSSATLAQEFNTDNYLKQSSVLHLTTATTVAGTTYIVASDTSGCVGVWSREGGKQFKPYVSLPKYKCVPSALAVDRAGEKLVIVYVDQKIVEYELQSRSFNSWPNIKLPNQWHKRTSAVLSVTFHTSNRDVIIFQDECALWVLNKAKFDQVDVAEPEAKKKACDNKKQKNNSNSALRIIPMKYLAGIEWVGEDEIAALEVLPENIISQLPPVLATKRFHSVQ